MYEKNIVQSSDKERRRESMKIHILGLEHIDLSTSSLFARNHEIVGVDKNKKIIDILNARKPPFNNLDPNELIIKIIGNFRTQINVNYVYNFLINFLTPLDKSIKIAHLKYVKSTDDFLTEVGSIINYFRYSYERKNIKE